MTGQAPGQAADFAEGDAAKLDTLAEWFDLFDNLKGRENRTEVQDDLRRWAQIVRRYRAAQEQPAPELAKILTADGRWAAMQPVPELAAETLKELTRIRSGIAGLAADLDRSAAETRPSRKSETESETAIALRRLLETP